MIESLTVVYDEQCALCRRCRHWLEMQRTLVPMNFLAAGSPEAQRLYSDLPWLGADLVVVSGGGDAWVGPSAFLMCLWATDEYRLWSYRLSGRALAPMAERFFHVVSKQRGRIGRRLGDPQCPDGSCKHRGLNNAAPAPASAPLPAPPGVPRTGHGVAATYTPPAEQWRPPQLSGKEPR